MLNLTTRRRIVRVAEVMPVVTAPVLLPILRVLEPVFQWIVDRYDGETYIAGIPVLRFPTRRQMRRYLVRNYGVVSLWGLFVNLMIGAAVGALFYVALIVLLAAGGN